MFHATFAAETQAAGDTIGMAHYLRACWCEILFGFSDWVDLTQYVEDQMSIVLFTDCRSLYDHL